MAMAEINEAAPNHHRAYCPEAKFIFGAVMDDKLKEGLKFKITVVATGFKQ